jgi:hypothetical protein
MTERIKELMEQTGVPLSMPFDKWCEKFAALVEAAARADEREACAKVCEDAPEPDGADLAERIRARGTT